MFYALYLTKVLAVLFCDCYSLYADTGVGWIWQMSEVWHSVLLEYAQHVDTKNTRSAAGSAHLHNAHLHMHVHLLCSLQSSDAHTHITYKLCSSVPLWLLHPGRECCRSQSTTISQPPSSCRSPLQHEHVRPSGLLCCWPNGLELTARQAPWPIAIDWQFPSPA